VEDLLISFVNLGLLGTPFRVIKSERWFYNSEEKDAEDGYTTTTYDVVGHADEGVLRATVCLSLVDAVLEATNLGRLYQTPLQDSSYELLEQESRL
jgi:hypothetical protein